MRKSWGIISLVFCACFLCFAGCGNIYANMKITTNCDDNLMEIVINTDDPESYSTSFEATLTGYSAGMNTGVDVIFSPTGVATYSVLSEADGVSRIQVTAIADNLSTAGATTTMTVVSRENSSIRSDPITLNVVLPVTGITASSATPSLMVGSSITLQTDNLINFIPSATTQRDVSYQIAPGYELAGVSIDGNVITANDTASTGIVKIIATSSTIMPEMTQEQIDALTCEINLMVYNPITGDDISLVDVNGNDIDAFTMATASDEINSSTFRIEVDTGNLEYRVNASIQNARIAYAEPSDDDPSRYTLNAFEIGETNLDVSVILYDPETGRDYLNIHRYVFVEVIQIAYSVQFTTASITTPTDQSIEINVLEQSATTRGTEVHVNIEPEGAQNRQYSISVHEIDGETENLQSRLPSILVYHYVNGVRELVTLEEQAGDISEALLNNDTSFYVCFTGDGVKEYFTLAISANSTDPNIPSVVNYVKCNIRAGVTSISAAVNGNNVEGAIYMGLLDGQNELPLTINYSTIGGVSVGTQIFNIVFDDDGDGEFDDNGLVTAERTSEFNIFTLRAQKEGTTTMRITSNENENGIYRDYLIHILVEPTELNFDVDTTVAISQGGKIASAEYNRIESDVEADDFGLRNMYLTLNTELALGLFATPANSTITDLVITSSDSHTVSVDGNKIRAVGVNITTPTYITATYTYWQYHEIYGWQMMDGVREFTVYVFVPIKNFTWAGSGEIDTNLFLYDSTALSYDRSSAGTATVTATVQSTGTNYATYQTIHWQNTDGTTFYDTDYLTITPRSDGRSFDVTARLKDGETSASTTFYLVLMEPGAVYTLSCTVHITKPQLVTSITSDTGTDGIYLEYGGLSQRDNASFAVETNPLNAYDSRVAYFIANAENVNGVIQKTGNWYSERATALGLNISLANNVVRALGSGYAIIRVVPYDNIHVNLDAFNPDELGEGNTYLDIIVTIANGDDNNPFQLYNADDLLALSRTTNTISLSKTYVLMQTIDMTGRTWTPIGSGTADGFTGKFVSNGYFNNTDIMYSIIGLSLSASSNDDGYYSGLFAKLTGATVGGIQIRASQANFDMTGASSGLAGYFGLLAGEIVNSSVKDVSVSMQNNVSLLQVSAGTGNNTVYFGGLAGYITGDASDSLQDISVDLNVNVDSSDQSILYVGGLVGYLGQTLSTTKSSSVNLTLASNGTFNNANLTNSNIGGVAGYLASGNQLIGYYSSGNITTLALDNVGGLVGYNAGIINSSETSMRLYARNNVGGIAGYNIGNLVECVVESYDSETLPAENIYAVRGVSNVGGLIGFSAGGNVRYSYLLSYIRTTNRTMANPRLPTIVDQTGSFYGDIIGNSNVGGLIGYNRNTTVTNSFNKAQISIYSETGSGFGGGLFGYMEAIESFEVSNSFANSVILAGAYNESANKVGEIAGNVVANNTINMYNVYARVQIDRFDENFEYKYLLQQAYGNTSGSLSTNNVYYYSTTGTGAVDSLDKFHNDSSTGGALTNLPAGSISGGSYGDNVYWINIADTIGYNDDALILVNSDKNGMLYKQTIQEIQIDQIKTEDTSAQDSVLPTYFSFSNGLVINLDNLWDSATQSYRSLAINDLLSLVVAPIIVNEDGVEDPSLWQLNVLSSDASIMTIYKPNRSLEGATLTFASTGVVVLTIQSMQDLNARASVEINVIAGLNSFDLQNNAGQSVANTIVNVKKTNSVNLTPVVGQSTNLINDVAVMYSIDKDFEQFFNLNGYAWSDAGAINLPVRNTTHSIRGVESTLEDTITVTATPYVTVTFGGLQTRLYLNGEGIGATGRVAKDLRQNFEVRVYNGLTAANLDTSSVELYSSDSYTLDLDFISDLPESVVCELVGDDYETMLANGYISTYKDSDNNRFQFYFEIPEDGGSISNIADSNRYLESDLVYNFTINLIDSEINETYRSYDVCVTFKPTPVSHITTRFYQNGESGIEADDVPNNEITPGRRAIMIVNVSDYFAYYDYIEVSSTRDPVTGDTVSLTQVVDTGRSDGNESRFQTIYGGSQQIDGKLMAMPVTQQTFDDQGNLVSSVYQDGIIYISAIIGSDVPEGTVFTLTLRAIKEGATSEPCTAIVTLTSCFAPRVTLSAVNNNYDQILVAKGTVLELNMSGIVQNTEVNITADYYGTADDYGNINDEQTICRFIDNGQGYTNVFTYMTGERETVQTNVRFYVGMAAAPTRGVITLTVRLTTILEDNVRSESVFAEYRIYVVDYLVDNIYMEGIGDNNTFVINPTSYTIFRMAWDLREQDSDVFETYINTENNVQYTNNFSSCRQTIIAKADQDLLLLNSKGATGIGDSIWSVYTNGAYASIGAGYSGNGFTLEPQEIDGRTYFCAKGIRITTGISMRADLFTKYVWDSNNTVGCWQMSTNEQDARETLVMAERVYNFTMNVENSSTDDSPYSVATAQDLRDMQAGAAYMLTADIDLYNWAPLDTAIQSLDGNGYTITIHSFAVSAMSGSTTTNIGLFGTLPQGTVLKNLIIDASYLAFVDARNFATVNFGIIAGTNNGVVYNSDVIVTANEATWYAMNADAINTNLSFVPQFGRDVFNSWLGTNEGGMQTGKATTIVLTSSTVSNNSVTSYIGGLVGYNSTTGSVTNSRVGSLERVGYLNYNAQGVQVTGEQGSQGLNIMASGNVAGLAGYNAGVVSASYYANGYIVNSQNNAQNTRTAGLVAEQVSTGRINTSYVAGVKTAQTKDALRFTDGGIMSYGTVGGLVHTNAGFVENCYTNIPLLSSNGIGGFVYQNSGEIYKSVSLSTIRENRRTSGNFVGIDANIDVQNTGTISQCYYLYQDNVIMNSDEPATALTAEEFTDVDGKYLQGFAFGIDTYGQDAVANVTWELTSYTDGNNSYVIPNLVEADNITTSYRGELAGASADAFTRPASCQLGSEVNPIIISSVADFNRIFNQNVGSGSNYDNKYYRIVSDIDFDGGSPAYSMRREFKGYIQGNGMRISGLNVVYQTSTGDMGNIGLFAMITGGVVANLELQLDNEISAGLTNRVGALAGTIGDDTVDSNGEYDLTVVENIRISGMPNTTGAMVQGLNMVGGLAGFVCGRTIIQNIESTISVYATYQTPSNAKISYYEGQSSSGLVSEMSYAGGIIGVVSLIDGITDVNYDENPTIKGLTVSQGVDILAETSGGVIGSLSTGAITRSVFEVDAAYTPRIRASNFAGGLVGENRGTILESWVSQEMNAQIASDRSITSASNAQDYLGYTGLFQNDEEVIAIGGLVGLNRGGTIRNSYSREAVLSDNALIAGGLIGVAVPYFDSSSADYAYLTDLVIDREQIFDWQFNTQVTYNSDTEVVNAYNSYAGTIAQAYTTSPVFATTATGGAIGLLAGSFISSGADLSPDIMAINNYPETDRYSTTTNITDDSSYVGGLVGYINMNLQMAEGVSGVPTIAVFVSGASTEVIYSDASIYIANGIVDNDIGHIQQSYGGYSSLSQINTVLSLNYINVATDSSINCFDGLMQVGDVWAVDIERTNTIFPVLAYGEERTEIEIGTADELFEALLGGASASYYKVVRDIVIDDVTWYRYVGTKGTLAGSTDTYINGQLYGAVPDGEDTRSATITLQISQTNGNLDRFNSLFGYTRNFTVMDMDFVFKFVDGNTYNNYTATDKANFALLVASGTNTTFRNISITSRDQDDNVAPLNITLNNVTNYGTFVAVGESCSFNKVTTNVALTVNNTTVSDEASIGGLFGSVANSVRVAGAVEVEVDFDTNSSAGVINVGAIGGYARDAFSVELISTGLDNGNIWGDIAVTAGNTAYVGGMIGKNGGNGYSKISAVVSNANIDVTLNSGVSETYAGGLMGYMLDTNASDSANYGSISLSKNADSGVFYVGGISGRIENTGTLLTLVNLINGRLVSGMTNYGDITVDIGTGVVYAGGIFGQAKYIMNTTPSGTTRNVFTGLASMGDINVDSQGTVYAGGLFGYLAQAFGSTEVCNNTCLRVASSVSLSNIAVQNATTMYVGGLAGYNGMAIYSSLANAKVTATSTQANVAYVGGAIGNQCCYLSGSVVLSTVMLSANMGYETVNMGAISGTNGTYGRIISVYYVPELVGIYDNNGIIISLADLDDWQNTMTGLSTEIWMQSIVPDGTNSNYTFMYPSEVRNSIDANDARMYIMHLSTDDMSIIWDSQFANADYADATLMLDFDTVDVSQFDNNVDLNNIRRLIGKTTGTSINVNQNNQAITVSNASGNCAVFDSISLGVLVSNININAPTINIESARTNANIAIFVAENHGSLFNCSAGQIPLASNNVPTLAEFANNLTESTGYNYGNANIRYTANVLYPTNSYVTDDQSTLVYKGTNRVNIAGLCATNYGNIAGSYTYVDIVVGSNSSSNVGELVADSSNSLISNSFAMGRITYAGQASGDTVGGLVGNATNTRISTSIANVNIYLSANTDSSNISNIGLGIGRMSNSVMRGVIVNSDISMAHDLTKFNTNYDLALTTYSSLDTNTGRNMGMSATNTNTNSLFSNSVSGYNFDFINIWAQDYTTNYGIPYLRGMNMTVGNTGNGRTANPFQIFEGIQFTRLAETDGIIAVLSRDIVYIGKDYTTSSDIRSRLDGRGHSIYVVRYNTFTVKATPDPDDNTYITYIGLFHNLTSSAEVRNVAIVGAYQTYDMSGNIVFGALAGTSSARLANVAVAGVATSAGSGVQFSNASSESSMGGIVGINNNTTISQSWADLDIIVNNGSVGGLIGTQNSSRDGDINLSKVFTLSTLSSSGPVGAFIGNTVNSAGSGSIRITNSYYHEFVANPTSFTTTQFVGGGNMSATLSNTYFVYSSGSLLRIALVMADGSTNDMLATDARAQSQLFGEGVSDTWETATSGVIGQFYLPWLVDVTPASCRDPIQWN